MNQLVKTVGEKKYGYVNTKKSTLILWLIYIILMDRKLKTTL